VLRVSVILALLLTGLPSAQAQEGPLQVIAPRRFLLEITDSLLPLSISTGSNSTIDLVDALYCGVTDSGAGEAVAVVFPAGVRPAHRLVAAADCASDDLHELESRVTAAPRRPDWFAVTRVAARWQAGKVSLAIARSHLNARRGVQVSPEIRSALNAPATPFHELATTGFKVTIGGEEAKFNLAVQFVPDGAILHVFDAESSYPDTLASPTGMPSILAMPTANLLLRVPHHDLNKFFAGSLREAAFPLDVGNQHLMVKNLQVTGGDDLYHTAGTVNMNNDSLDLVIDWAGPDLGFDGVQVPAASASCGAIDLRCQLRRGIANGLKTFLSSGVVAHGQPFRPVGARDVASVAIGERTCRVRMAILRSTSTTSALYLISSAVLESP
jgi:hypothetical protein